MKAALAAFLLWHIVAPRPLPEPVSFRYRRVVTVPPASRGSEACAALDAAVYAHAAASLKDVRLLRPIGPGVSEVPYAITISEPADTETESAAVRNLARSEGEIALDLAMPARPYTDVVLDLDGRNFIASVEVSGSAGTGPSTPLGTFTLFDLSAEHLGRGTTLSLQETTFPMLHVVLRFFAASGEVGLLPSDITVKGAAVPPSREAQTVYTMVAETTKVTQEGRDTVARFALPAHVPVERIAVDPEPESTANFSRSVAVVAHTAAAVDEERLNGQVQRVRLQRAGHAIRQEQLGFPATLGANLQADATVEVRIWNGGDPPLRLRTVRLEMRERRLCFPADAHATPWDYVLFYGDPAQATPRYDVARSFSPSARSLKATLSAEALNPRYVAQALRRGSMMERYPELLWVVLLAAVCVFAVAVIHAARRRGHPRE